MPRRRHCLLVVVALCGAAGGVRPCLPQPMARGPEVVVDSLAADRRECLAIAGRADGRVAVVWSRGEYGRDRLLARIDDPRGGLLDGVTLHRDSEAVLIPRAIVATPDGYRALWAYERYFFPILRSSDIDSEGLPASPKELGREGWDDGLSPRPSGGYVKHWITDRAAFVQLLDDEGLATSSGPSRVSLTHASEVFVLHQTDGSFQLLTREDLVRGASGYRISAQRFDREGEPVGSLVTLLPARPGLSTLAAALGVDGTLAVAAVYHASSTDSLILRTFSPNGDLLWDRLAVTTSFPEGLQVAAVSVDPAGRVLLVWSRSPAPGEIGRVVARAFDPSGNALGPPFTINSRAVSSRIHCVQASWSGEDWVFAWDARVGDVGEERFLFRTFLRRFARD